MIEEVQGLKEIAASGADVKAFLTTGAGKYLKARAEVEEYNTLRELAFVDPTDTAKIISAQIKARVAGSVLNWLANALTEGEAAEFQLQEILAEKSGF
jgi:ferredoxin-NADP reductase